MDKPRTTELSDKISAAEQEMREHFRVDGPVMHGICKNLMPFGVDNPEDAMEIAKVRVRKMLEALNAERN